MPPNKEIKCKFLKIGCKFVKTTPKFLFKENFLPHPHKAATHNACALVRAMASYTREANTDDERALWMAALRKDVKTLTSLLQKGVCPNVKKVC